MFLFQFGELNSTAIFVGFFGNLFHYGSDILSFCLVGVPDLQRKTVPPDLLIMIDVGQSFFALAENLSQSINIDRLC